MVRMVHKIVMPTSGGTINSLNRKHISGKGYGSVLLDGGQGGYGSASSYSSIDDYINTTHINPLKKSVGSGIESMNKKIESLLVNSKKGLRMKPKNINFNI